VSINISALLAAIEFGIQPIFYHDATGAPLYAPYTLHVAIPSMMIGHLTIAGVAELVLTAGIVAYLQRADPTLLRFTAERTLPFGEGCGTQKGAGFRRLWIGLGLLMLLAPVGVLAVGTAWGEWSARDFGTVEARQKIADASQNQAPPAVAPAGLKRLSRVWTAPFPAYAPGIVRNERFGYMLSAMFGVGLVILAVFGVSRLL